MSYPCIRLTLALVHKRFMERKLACSSDSTWEHSSRMQTKLTTLSHLVANFLIPEGRSFHEGWSIS